MRIPVPLNALRAFEAAARHLSIKDAALELAVTPSAVSHQLRTLEDLLGVELLRRVGATVELTDAGRRLAPTLNAGFCHIAASVQALRDERLDGPLRLHTLPAIAINWLAPRLAAYPFGTAESALDITTVQGHADLAAGTADVGLWFGEPPWPGLVSETLFAGSLGVYARAGSLAATPRGTIGATGAGAPVRFPLWPALGAMAADPAGRSPIPRPDHPGRFLRPRAAGGQRRNGAVPGGGATRRALGAGRLAGALVRP
ncbi:TPA: LysR family transcriptional regulator [Pseudomonas aeruginosa]|nr:LysR family transcriptional regulator [Pseudomonas aeruginosa]HCL4360787.1 LysR family transcriptional regulator [Pseudomonas aeruginosa]